MKVKFLPTGQEIPITPEKTLLQAALENHIDIKSICKGKLVCAECRVKVVEGEANLLPPSKAELNLIGTSWQLDSRRYACQVRCFGDVTIDLTEQMQRAESQRKNIRGFKSSRPASESTAVIDTMILNEKIEASDERPARAETPGEGGAEGGEPKQARQEKSRDENKGRRDRGGGRNDRRDRRDENRGSRDEGRGGGGKSEGRGGNKGEGRGESRGENKGGGRGQNRGESKGGGRGENRGQNRNENRSDRRPENGSEPRGEAGGESRGEGPGGKKDPSEPKS